MNNQLEFDLIDLCFIYLFKLVKTKIVS